MILGVGMDLIEVARVVRGYEQFGDRFVTRLLREEEARYCLSHGRPGPFLAARFAAKEAVAKAFGTGIGALLGWHDVEIGRAESGQPFVILHEKGLTLMHERGVTRVHLSITHTESHAAAVAILEGLP
jgi:holo-[acyl-carrier protein] synthase